MASRLIHPLSFATREIRARDLRHKFLPPDMCAGPKWAMMLYLASSYAAGRAVYTTALTSAAASPSTTALRHIDQLERAGLAERFADDIDGRRTLVRLTNKGFDAMVGYADRIAA